MSVYLVKGKGWRFDFTQNGTRYTEAWFKTKKAAMQAEMKRKEALNNPQQVTEQIQIDMAFLELVNRRLDHVKAYNSTEHYKKYLQMAKRWCNRWQELPCNEVTQEMIQTFILERNSVSAYTANKEIRYLRATFNFGIKKGFIISNPTKGIDFLPVEKKIKFVPPSEDIDKLIAMADPDTQDYLGTIRETLGRVSEINQLKWDDVSLKNKYVILYTRKKRGGHLTPREVGMTEKLYEILSRRYAKRDPAIPWVFDHTYRAVRAGQKKEGPFLDRREVLKSLCKKAGVRQIGFHALRHSGASVMDENNVPIGVIQRILGHENRTTTEIYLHSISNADREAMRIFEQARKKSHTESHTEAEEKEKDRNNSSSPFL